MQATRVRSKAKTSNASKSAIDIRGTSTKIVTEFFEFSVNTILYQRNVYPPEDFKMVKHYGLNMLVSTDEALMAYLRKIMSQLSTWLRAGKVSRLVLAIIAKESREVLERWQFNVTLEDGTNEEAKDAKENQLIALATKPPKSEKEIHAEIQAIIRQITASVTFLPVIDEKCSFNILVYTGKDTEVPTQWQEDDAHMITGTTEQVKLRGFSTSVHKVDALVAYRLGED